MKSEDFKRFWLKVSLDKYIPCWTWLASLDRHGYGQFRLNGRTRRAHQVAWECIVGPIPTGKELDHLCGRPSCVNPAHLDPVSHAENIRRGKGGEHQRIKSHCPQGHPYNEENTRMYEGRRYCRACHKFSTREAWRKKNWRGYDSNGNRKETSS